MKGHLGKSCKISIDDDGRRLIYSDCNITHLDNNHITFTDKYKTLYTFKRSSIAQIKND